MSAQDPTPRERRRVVDSVLGEVLAQLDDLSKDTMAICGVSYGTVSSPPSGPLLEFAEATRLALQKMVDNWYLEWCSAHDLPDSEEICGACGQWYEGEHACDLDPDNGHDGGPEPEERAYDVDFETERAERRYDRERAERFEHGP